MIEKRRNIKTMMSRLVTNGILIWGESFMENKENMLRMAVKARKRYLVRLLLSSDFYHTHESLEKLEGELEQLTLSELEERWKMIQVSSDDQII